MLEKLLELISQNGTVQPATLARQLDVSPALVEQMIEHLERVGYLKVVEGCAESHCTGCSVVEACGTSKIRFWERVK